jgi:hypothetical protein
MLALNRIFRSLRCAIDAAPLRFGVGATPPSRLASTDSTDSTTESKALRDNNDPIILCEDLPPIPPNYGWIGDSNLVADHAINVIRASFKYGYFQIAHLAHVQILISSDFVQCLKRPL